MRVVITSSGAVTVLGDDAKHEYVVLSEPEDERDVKFQPLFRAAFASILAREGQANRTNTRTLRVTRSHETAAAAFIFSETHASQLPIKGILSISHAGGSVYYADAAIKKVKCVEAKSVRTVFDYTIFHGAPSLTPISTT